MDDGEVEERRNVLLFAFPAAVFIYDTLGRGKLNEEFFNFWRK